MGFLPFFTLPELLSPQKIINDTRSMNTHTHKAGFPFICHIRNLYKLCWVCLSYPRQSFFTNYSCFLSDGIVISGRSLVVISVERISYTHGTVFDCSFLFQSALLLCDISTDYGDK